MGISTGFTLCRSLHVIAELGITDALGETPLGADALAAATGTHPDALERYGCSQHTGFLPPKAASTSITQPLVCCARITRSR